MRRTTPYSRLSSLALATALLAGSGCVIHLGDWGGDSSDLWGHNVSSHAGSLTVDDTELNFERWVDVTADVSGSSKLELGTATEAIRVSGVPGTVVTLRAHLYSEFEGDGTAVFEQDRLVARSQAGGVVFINAIEGTVPAGLELSVQSGTGDVDVWALSGDQHVDVQSGTGDVSLRISKLGSAYAHSGTGDVRLVEADAGDLQAKSGTGDVSMERCHAPELKLDSGTGDAWLVGCEAGSLKVKCGTGDLTLDAGKFDGVVFDSGTGDFSLVNGVSLGSFREN